MAINMKQLCKIMGLAAIVVVSCLAMTYLGPKVMAMFQRSLRQRKYDDAWAKEHGYNWHDKYSNTGGWGGGLHPKYYNVHADRQLYDKNTGQIKSGGPIGGFGVNTPLRTLPFKDVFAHTDIKYAEAMPEGAEIEAQASPYSAVPEGQQPWKESYHDTPSRWAGEGVSPSTKMFDVYDDNYKYNKKSGKMIPAPLERKVDPSEYGNAGGSRGGAAAKALEGMTEEEKEKLGAMAGVGEEIYKAQPWDATYAQ